MTLRLPPLPRRARTLTVLALALTAGAATALPSVASAGTVTAQGAGTAARPNFKHSPVTADCTRTGYVDDPGNPDPDPCTDLPLSTMIISARPAARAPKAATTTIANGRWSAPTRVRAVRFDPDPIFGTCGSTTIGIWTLKGMKLWSASPTDCGWVTVPVRVYAGGDTRLLLRGALVA